MVTKTTFLKRTMDDNRRMQEFMEEQRVIHERRLRQMDDDHQRDIDSVVTRHEKESENLEKAFSVEFSRKAKEFEGRLSELQTEHQSEIKNETENYEKEFESIEKRESKKVENFRKKREENIADLHEEFLEAEEELRAYYDG